MKILPLVSLKSRYFQPCCSCTRGGRDWGRCMRGLPPKQSRFFQWPSPSSQGCTFISSAHHPYTIHTCASLQSLENRPYILRNIESYTGAAGKQEFLWVWGRPGVLRAHCWSMIGKLEFGRMIQRKKWELVKPEQGSSRDRFLAKPEGLPSLPFAFWKRHEALTLPPPPVAIRRSLSAFFPTGNNF